MISPIGSSLPPTLISTARQCHPALPGRSAGGLIPPSVDGDPTSQGPTLREAFDTMVGQTFYDALLKSMRKTLGKPAYFHGGRAEEVFQSQLDQTLAEEMTKANANQLAGPMFQLFTLPRPG